MQSSGKRDGLGQWAVALTSGQPIGSSEVTGEWTTTAQLRRVRICGLFLSSLSISFPERNLGAFGPSSPELVSDSGPLFRLLLASQSPLSLSPLLLREASNHLCAGIPYPSSPSAPDLAEAPPGR